MTTSTTTRITGPVSIDRDTEGQLWLSRDHIVISDDDSNVVALVPYDVNSDTDERTQDEQLAEEIVRRLNATDQLQTLLAALVANRHTPEPAGPGPVVTERIALYAQAETLLAQLKGGAR